MKLWQSVSLLLALVIGVLLYRFAGDVLASRHRVSRLTWNLPSNQPAMLSDSLALEAIRMAFKNSSYDPALWQPVIADEASGSIWRRPYSTNAGSILLSNKNSGKKLYASIELDVTNRIMKVDIVRSK